jgi:hypothetical protein
MNGGAEFMPLFLKRVGFAIMGRLRPLCTDSGNMPRHEEHGRGACISFIPRYKDKISKARLINIVGELRRVGTVGNQI